MVDASGIQGRVACKAILGNGGSIVLAILRDSRCIIIVGLRNGRSIRIPRCQRPLGDGCLVIVSPVLCHRGGAVGVVVGVVLADGRNAIGPILRDVCSVRICIGILTALSDGHLITRTPRSLGHRGCLVVATLADVQRTGSTILHGSRCIVATRLVNFDDVRITGLIGSGSVIESAVLTNGGSIISRCARSIDSLIDGPSHCCWL